MGGLRDKIEGIGQYRGMKKGSGDLTMNSRVKRRMGLFLVAVMFISVLGGTLTLPTAEAASVDHVIITAVYYDAYKAYEPEEFVRIHNPTGSAADLSGWIITDQTEVVTFPSGISIAPGESLFLTKNATAFEEQMAEAADYEYDVDSDPNVPQLDGTIGFANTGDEVILKDALGNIVDVVVYGSSTYTHDTHWTGSPVPAVSEGVILERDVSEATGEYDDTNTAADWDDNRVYWVGQSHFDYETISFTGSVTAFTSPDSSFEVISGAVDNATSSFYLNIYQIHSIELMDHIVQACDRGVDVRLFIEGTPVGVTTEQKNLAKHVAQQINNAGGQIRYMITDDARDIHDRYTWDHAKYCIIDNDTVIVMSENWKTTGVPVNNTGGNRGWGVVIESADVASYFLMVFEDDWDIRHNDVFPYTEGDPRYGAPPADYEPVQKYPSENYVPYFPAETVYGSFSISPVFAPDTSLLETKAILGMIDSATKSVYVEQVYAHKHWGTPTAGDTTTMPNLYLEACIDAARRGCEVKILLGSSFIDRSDPRNNEMTAEYVNGIAAEEGLDLSARLVDLGLTDFEKIHNKGVIVDGKKTLVSSINWGKNSPTNNREACVIIENEDVAAFYTEVFLFDWPHIIISEVFYDTPGTDAEEEFIELHNPTSVDVDLGGWTLSDNAGSCTLPSGTTIRAKESLTIARDSTGFKNLFGFDPHVSGLTLSLSNNGDQVSLKDKQEAKVDFVAYENYVPGWDITANTNESIQRINLEKDTGSVADWTVGPPSPSKPTADWTLIVIGTLAAAGAVAIIIIYRGRGKGKKGKKK